MEVEVEMEERTEVEIVVEMEAETVGEVAALHRGCRRHQCPLLARPRPHYPLQVW